MYVFEPKNNFDWVSHDIIHHKSLDRDRLLNMKEAIEYYEQQNKITETKKMLLI